MNHTKGFMRAATVVCALFISATTSYGQDNAGEYLDVISGQFNEIRKNTWDYTRSAAHGKSARKVEKRRKEVIAANKEAIAKIGRLKPFNGDAQIRDSALSFLKVNYAVLNEDYAKLMDLEEIAEQSYDAMEAYMKAKDVANEKLTAAGDMIERQYEIFANKNNITLIHSKDKLSKNMEIANKVYRHYNAVYLIFFKSYKQEVYLMDAMARNDVSAIEQNRSALAKSSNEGLEKVSKIEPYNNDRSLIKSCEEMLKFYKQESEQKLASVSAFYVAKDNFEKARVAMDAKPQADRTQEDVNSYNKLLGEYNNAVAGYNKVNDELNSQRSSSIQAWNKAGDQLLDKHVPSR